MPGRPSGAESPWKSQAAPEIAARKTTLPVAPSRPVTTASPISHAYWRSTRKTSGKRDGAGIRQDGQLGTVAAKPGGRAGSPVSSKHEWVRAREWLPLSHDAPVTARHPEGEG